MSIKGVLVQSFVKSLIKKTSGSGIKSENLSDQQLAEELHKPTIRTFKKKKYTIKVL